ncbi:UNVERIFIED_ORG: putative metal-dependent enzyme (double-stranded beta helix superfamily) [Rhizobium pisi]
MSNVIQLQPAATIFDDEIEDALQQVAGELGLTRNDTIRTIVREWLQQNTYLPVHELDEDGDVGGNA